MNIMRRCKTDEDEEMWERGVKDRRGKIKGADRVKMIRNG